MTGTEIYKRTPAYDREATSIRLHAPQWKLLLAYDGQRSLAEVALSVDVAFADALPLTEQYLGRGWIEELPITLDQYLKRTNASSVSAMGSAVTPAIVLHAPRSEAAAPAVVPASALMEETTKSFRAASPEPKPKEIPRGPMRLSAVVDYIVSQVGNSSLGQLVVYRVFLRVPPDLLQAEDIVSVHLAGDPSVVKTEPLKKAIQEAVTDVLQRPLPDSVFAPA
jgi:hypothetical protein